MHEAFDRKDVEYQNRSDNGKPHPKYLLCKVQYRTEASPNERLYKYFNIAELITL